MVIVEVDMRRLNRFISGGFLMVLLLAASGCATLGMQPSTRAEISEVCNDTVRIVAKGPVSLSASLASGEVVPVWRAYPGERLRYLKVGMVKITGFRDAGAAEGVVLEGSPQVGDLIRKSDGGA
jgi:hypothetical protein